MGITTVFVTHNLADVAEMGDRVVALNNGKIWLMPPEMFKKDGDNGNHIHHDCLHCVMDCYCKGKEGGVENLFNLVNGSHPLISRIPFSMVERDIPEILLT
jgi:energy-coupling factor transporter ATP-binding protein EcfA2